MRLQADVLRYMSKGEFRVLTAVEMGMKNHEFVSSVLIEQIAGLRRHSIRQILSTLLKNKLVFHCSKMYDGYKLTYLGYDYLALNSFVKRGLLKGVGARVGVGKESDIHICEATDGGVLILKLHRLGRISFRSIKKNRDYMQHRTHCSWHYLAHLAAVREFAYLKALHDHGFPVPQPVDMNRHAVLMHYVDAIPLTQMFFCGFLLLPDLPQMVSIYHPNAKLYFDRDVECIKRLFERKFLVNVTAVPKFDEVVSFSSHPSSSRADFVRSDVESAAEGNETERAIGPITISDGLDDEQAKLLEGALAARKEAAATSDAEERSIEEEESPEDSDEDDSDEESATDAQGQTSDDSKEAHRTAEQDSTVSRTESSEESGNEEGGDAAEEPSRPLAQEEQLALIHCWRPTAKR
ncbi:hypothetical protein Emag_006022 [Eimeria magna]